jgi:hypothetical protein
MLLRAQWPLQILEHENAAHVTLGDVLRATAAHPRYAYLVADAREMLADKKAGWARAPACLVRCSGCFLICVAVCVLAVVAACICSARRRAAPCSSSIAQSQSCALTRPRPQDMPLFRGLRVRMTIHTDVADAVTRHQITQKLLYQGSVYDVCEALTDFAKGGQVALSASTYGRLCHDARKFYTTKQRLQAALTKTKQTAMRREIAGLRLQERVHKCAPPHSPRHRGFVRAVLASMSKGSLHVAQDLDTAR